ncbi:hypothetical protein BUALT_Bualt14G0005700 [Buddleja alternifolia]|uniref:Glycosyltransferase N-terminal domain-containing protein n=1 Tax=Buddleja alternifolia TaxID=168488 RepID=A0AAV6WQU4_9LAMI|nr:hypothetical protein BUALT_Bualt14G0005700 [Buddleja alternifolia]
MGQANHDQVPILMVPFPAQSHLNQLLQFSCLISSYCGISVHFIASAIHNRQTKSRINGLNPQDIAKINFHDLPIPPFVSPPPNPNSSNKFPAQLQPCWDASMNLRKPFSEYLHEISEKCKRVIVVHDIMMASVVEDVASIHNAESYAFNVFSAFYLASFATEAKGKPYPIPQHPKERINIPSFEDCLTDEFSSFEALQYKPRRHRSGNIHNTCRLLEGPYLDILASEDIVKKRKSWAIGPIFPAKLLSSQRQSNKYLAWLDKHGPKSVMYVAFGTTVSLSDEQIKELALGLEQSKVKFIWSLRDADKGDVFDAAEVRRPQLPQGFEERVEGVGMVVRDWAPQPEILAHPSIGGFLMPCGWSSCIESISMGVPIAAWPMLGDQPRTAVLITDILKIGFVVREWAKRKEIVKASRIENVVRILMASEEGDQMRKRAEEFAATVRMANQPGGVSRLELDSFIAHITRPNNIVVSKI